MTNVEKLSFPDGIVIPKKYVNQINGNELHIGEKVDNSKMLQLKPFKYCKLVILDFTSETKQKLCDAFRKFKSD